MNSPQEIVEKFRPAEDFLLKLLKDRPDVAFVAGSGIGEALENCGEILLNIPYSDIPGFNLLILIHIL